MRHLIEEARRLLETHERCAKGSHWNDNSRKCEELPPELKKTHDAAWDKTFTHRGASGHADDQDRFGASDRGSYFDAPKSPESAKNHGVATATGTTAHHAHTQAAMVMHQHGFRELAKNHEMLARDHLDSAKGHAKKAGKAGLDHAKQKYPKIVQHLHLAQ